MINSDDFKLSPFWNQKSEIHTTEEFTVGQLQEVNFSLIGVYFTPLRATFHIDEMEYRYFWREFSVRSG